MVTEGDFYTAPGKGIEDIPDYYAVVDDSYRPPLDISSSRLEAMHIPDNNPALENEALRLTGNLEDGNESMSGYEDAGILKKSYPGDVPGEDGDIFPSEGTRVCHHYPSGRIQLVDETISGHTPRSVGHVRVVVERYFKVESLDTDDNGNFASHKYFRNKYTILLKFKNSLSHIARMRPKAFHEQFFPIKVNLGKWSRLDCGHTFRINHPENTGTLQASHWCAAMAHNAVMEHRRFSMEGGIETPPQDLHIMLSSKQGAGNGNAYMLSKVLYSSPAAAGTEVLVAGAVAAWVPVAGELVVLATEAYKARCPDIKFGYGGEVPYLASDRYTELVYHELSHANMYSVVGNDWWIKFGLAENGNKGPGAYGECCSDKAYHIALGEGWAYFAGHYFAARRWGMLSTRFPEQGNLETNEGVIFFANDKLLNSHERFLESYDPQRAVDQSSWIPKGLFYDLIDPPIEQYPGNGIVDRVGGFTAREIFSVMSKDIRDLRAYRDKLIRMFPTRDTAAIRELFRQYGY